MRLGSLNGSERFAFPLSAAATPGNTQSSCSTILAAAVRRSWEGGAEELETPCAGAAQEVVPVQGALIRAVRPVSDRMGHVQEPSDPGIGAVRHPGLDPVPDAHHVQGPEQRGAGQEILGRGRGCERPLVGRMDFAHGRAGSRFPSRILPAGPPAPSSRDTLPWVAPGCTRESHRGPGEVTARARLRGG